MNYNTYVMSTPNICRCCLSNVGFFDIRTSYRNMSESINTSLEKYFGITLAIHSGSSYVICGECAKNIEDISNFHEKIKLSVEKYNEFWIQTQGNQKTYEISWLQDDSILKERRHSSSSTEDSDLPISMLLKKNEINQFDKDFLEEKLDLFPIKLPKIKKQVSERKQVIITCGIVLKDTTACPFRHFKSWFRCFFCSQDYMELKLLREHTTTTHFDVDNELQKIKRYPRSIQIDITSLECRKCQINLTDVDSMCRHFNDVHKKIIYKECIADYKVDASPFTCHICKKEFHVFRTLTTHLNEHYANCICDVCGKSFLNSKRLKVHKRTHESGSYPCRECGKILKTKTSKANHMESAHSKRILKCHICEKPMKHYNDRIKHMSEVHNITHTFKCPFCTRVYNIKHYLATHIRQTHGNKNKKCSECNMSFITNHSLKKHMVKHSGEKPYSCNLCCKSYTRSYTLKEHMREHEKCDFYSK